MIKRQLKASEINVPSELLDQWQLIANGIAELIGIPACLVMRVSEEDIQVFIASQNKGNPYQPGAREHLADSGLYCETVIRTERPLLVPDALSDPNWKSNPDIKLDMISYLGFPVFFPDGTPFGTFCVLDNKPNAYNDSIRNLLENLRNLLQQHLGLLYMNAVLGEKNTDLMAYLDEIQSLRGLIPICAKCKKIKNTEGYWDSIEKYLSKYPEADFTHGYCPDCYDKIMHEE